MKLTVDLKENSYDIIIKRHSLEHLDEYLDPSRRVLIISDDGIPNDYIQIVSKQFPNGNSLTFSKGEENKNLNTYSKIISTLSTLRFTRKDMIIALGGGLTSDLAGFVASSYMRGIDFVIIPTTLLSQVDASIGGKVGINFNGIKNLVGAFYQPKKVIIDSETLKTLDERLLHEGLVEAIKMAATSDKELFSLIEKSENLEKDIDEIIYRSLLIKKGVVEKDEKESSLRQVLNFGHTVGHAMESLSQGEFFHGECVGMGMLYFSYGEARQRIEKLLDKYNLPKGHSFSVDDLMNMISHDKKSANNNIIVVKVRNIGEFSLEKMSFEDIKEEIKNEK